MNFSELMNRRAMFPLNNKPRRITRTTTTLIENIFTSEIKTTVDSEMIIENVSVHLPIFAICHFVERSKQIHLEKGRT